MVHRTICAFFQKTDKLHFIGSAKPGCNKKYKGIVIEAGGNLLTVMSLLNVQFATFLREVARVTTPGGHTISASTTPDSIASTDSRTSANLQKFVVK